MHSLRSMLKILMIAVWWYQGVSSTEITSFFSTTNRCDYLIIAPRFLREGAATLACYRNQHDDDDVHQAGYVVFETLLEQVSGKKNLPDSLLRSSIVWARENWSVPPSYVVLLGDAAATVNYDDVTGWNRGPLPTHITMEEAEDVSPGDSTRLTATVFDYSDDWFVKTCIDSDNVTCSPMDPCFINCPDRPVAIGRIPCETPEQFDRYLRKLERYEALQEGLPWRNRILLVADDRFEGMQVDNLDHAFYVNATKELLPGRFQTGLYFSDYTWRGPPGWAEAKRAFFANVNNGAAWTICYAHGTPSQLTGEHILEAADYTRFVTAERPTFFFALGCSNGGFYVPECYSMCKRYLFDTDGGAIIYIANPNTTIYPYSFPFMRRVIQVNDSLPGTSIGKILAIAKSDICLASANSFEVFGDPALPSGLQTGEIEMYVNGDGTILMYTGNAVDHGTLMWEITERKTWYDTLFHTDEQRDTVLYFGSKEVRGGQVTLAIPPVPKSNLLQVTSYAWNGLATARGNLKLYYKARPDFPSPLLSSFVPFPESSISNIINFGDSILVGVLANGTIVRWSLQPSGRYPMKIIGRIPPAEQVALCSSTSGNFFIFHSDSVNNRPSHTLRKIDATGREQWMFNDSAIDGWYQVEPCDNGGCILWNSSGNLFRIDATGRPGNIMHLDAPVNGVKAYEENSCFFVRIIDTLTGDSLPGTALCYGRIDRTGEKQWERYIAKWKLSRSCSTIPLNNESWIIMAAAATNDPGTILMCVNNHGDTVWTKTIGKMHPVSCSILDDGTIALSGRIDADGVIVLFDCNGNELNTMNVQGGTVTLLARGAIPGRYLAVHQAGTAEKSPGILCGIDEAQTASEDHLPLFVDRHPLFGVNVRGSGTIVFSFTPFFPAGSSINLFDLRGRIVKRIPVNHPIGQVTERGNSFAAGSYIAQVHIEGRAYRSLVVVE